MTSRRRKLWIGLIVSFCAAAGAGFSVAVNLFAAFAMSRSPAGERAMVWAYSSGGMAVLFAALCVYCLVCLVRERNIDRGGGWV